MMDCIYNSSEFWLLLMQWSNRQLWHCC